jgi:hypothetical protein
MAVLKGPYTKRVVFLESRYITDNGYIIIKCFSLHFFAKECMSISLR